MCILIKLGAHISHGERMNSIDFGGQRSKVRVTMDIYGNKHVNKKGGPLNTIEI